MSRTESNVASALPLIGQRDRSAAGDAGRFEQEVTELTERDSTLCFLGLAPVEFGGLALAPRRSLLVYFVTVRG